VFDWELRHGWFLLATLVAPLIFWIAKRPGATIEFSSLALLDRAPRSLRARLARLPAAFLAVAVTLLAIALAGPRTPDHETRVSREGIAIVMVVDRSGSMNARDMVEDDLGVDRMTAVKNVFRDFVLGDNKSGSGRPDDMIGLIAFASFADSLCPLTLDHGNLTTMAEDVEIATDETESATAIGEGLALAVERLRNNPAQSKVVILLTDGFNNAGQIEPLQAAQLAFDYDIKVYAIGVGTDGLAPFPAKDLFGRDVLRPMRVEIDEETLQKISDKTGGRYFRATDMEGLAKIYTEIDHMERTQLTEVRYRQYTEHYGIFVLGALGLIAVAAIANGTVFRRLP